MTRPRMSAVVVLAAAVTFAMTAATACSRQEKSSDLRHWTKDMSFRVSMDPMPPIARTKVKYKVVVRDKESGQPIEKGEGRIFATSRDGVNTWDALLPGDEPGTYYGELNYLTAGDWAIAIQFRRDSLSRLERVDWMQGVRRPPQPNGT
jgi:hypothetical protein